MLATAEYLANHIHEAPVWIVPCLEGATPTRTSGSSIYPAVQNMLLAAPAPVLGATLPTLYTCSSRRHPLKKTAPGWVPGAGSPDRYRGDLFIPGPLGSL